jgi:hypothetical protein
MKGEGKALDMTVKIAAEIMDHSLADADGRVVVENTQTSGDYVKENEAATSDPEEPFSRP